MNDSATKKFGWSILRTTLAIGIGLLMVWGALEYLDATLEKTSSRVVVPELNIDLGNNDAPDSRDIEEEKTDPYFDMRMS